MGFFDRLFGRTEYAPTVAEHEAESRARASAALPFRMIVEDVFAITGRGTVATGTIEAGSVSVGDVVWVETPGAAVVSARVDGLEAFRKVLTTAVAGEKVGILFETPPPAVERGSVLTDVEASR